MRNSSLLLSVTGVVAFLFVTSIIFSVVNGFDSFRDHSGLGDSISVSPDDSTILFSYYENGREAIYKGGLNDGEVERVTEPTDEDHRMPQFAPDGKGILYLAANNEDVQSLHYLNDSASSDPIELTGADAHVSDAVFSPDGRTIFYIAIPAEDFLKPEGEKENGADLFSVAAEGGEVFKLTDKDSFAMDGLAVSADGTTLYYTEFDGMQRLMAYSIEEGTESAYLQEYSENDLYQPAFSSGGELLSYTAVSEESLSGGSTFEYELFLMEISTGETKRLTDLNASVTSPAFFHHENRIAFLTQPNWPDEPAVYDAMTVDYSSDAEIASLELNFPEPANGFRLSVIAHWFTHPLTVTGLYLLLFSLLTVYSRSALNKGYLPAAISAIFTGIAFAAGVVAVAFNPWAAIGIFTLAAGLAGCTVIILIFTYMYGWFGKTARRNLQS